MIDINKIPIVNPAQLEKFLEGSVKVEMGYPEIYKKNKKNKVSKLKTIIDKSLENVFWVSHQGKFLGSSDYPQEFEQKYGNISHVSLAIDDYLFDKQQLDRIHDFLRKWNFDVTQQYKINEYNTGYYYCDDLTLMVRATFGMPEDKVEKEDDEGEVFSTNNSGIAISFSPLVKNRKMIEEFLKEFVDESFWFIPNDEKKFYMIAQNQQGLYNQSVNFESTEIKNGEYERYYGKGFPHEKMLEFVTNNDTDNLMIIHGPPGTGKSEYLKHLFQFSDRKVIYVPPSMLAMISTPSFVSYMIQNRGSLIVIEDSEEILSVDRNAATQNLLGMSSGLLKSALDIKCICTLNCDIGKIDPALLRKGRLHFEHLFRKLTREEGRELAEFVGINIEIDDEITISEIFNNAATSVKDNFEKPKLGFGNF
jgi:hypothetical protein